MAGVCTHHLGPVVDVRERAEQRERGQQQQLGARARRAAQHQQHRARVRDQQPVEHLAARVAHLRHYEAALEMQRKFMLSTMREYE